MNAKEKFCRSFEWDVDIKWFDLDGYLQIDDNRRVRISLSDSAVRWEYNGFAVTILDKNDGKIDARKFFFGDYLDIEKRADDRSDYKPSSFYAQCDRKGLKWYIAIPQTTRPLCREIEKYISIFR